MATKPTAIPALGTIAGLARKEGISDTEGWAPGVAMPSQIITFANFTSFATAGLSLTKQFGRDTNLTGGQGGLPQAHRFLAYKWRMKIRSLDANLNTAANAGVPEQINRAREVSFGQFQLAQSNYITCQADELLGFTDSKTYSQTQTTQTMVSPTVGDRAGKDLTVAGEPKVLEPLENFRLVTGTPAYTNAVGPGMLSPTVSLYVTHFLDGVLIRGITG